MAEQPGMADDKGRKCKALGHNSCASKAQARTRTHTQVLPLTRTPVELSQGGDAPGVAACTQQEGTRKGVTR
jgi:hypothetical protein